MSTPAPARASATSLLLGFAAGTAALMVAIIAPRPDFGWLASLRTSAAAHASNGKSYFPLICLGAIALAAAVFSGFRSNARNRQSHGSAKWEKPETYAATEGFLLAGRGGRGLLRHAGEAHLLTVAPSGTGKGVGVVIPNLLEYPGSVVCIDIKGENYAVTAGYRQHVLGQRIQVLDPFGVVLNERNPQAQRHRATYNVLDFVQPHSPDAFDAANLIASSLIVADPGAQLDSIWIEAARDIATALLLHIAADYPPDRRHLGSLASLLSLPDEALRAKLDQLAGNPMCGPLVTNAVNRLRGKDERMFGSVYFTAATKGVRGILEAPSLLDVSRVSSFRFRDLRSLGTTVYLILPPNYVDTWGRWLRLLVSAALHELTPADPPATPHRLLLLLDELPTLGHLPTLAEKIAYGRGYGLSLWLIVQDLAQLRDRYPKQWETLLSQTAIKQFFGTNDNFTAEYVSKLTGQTTVISHSVGDSRGTSASSSLFGGGTSSHSNTQGSVGRPLLFADEIRTLPAQQLLLFQAGLHPLKAERLSYLTHPYFRGRYGKNPLHHD